MAAIKKIKPQGGIKIIVSDSNGQARLLGTIPIWENPSPAQRWVINNPDSELTAQCVYVKAEEEFSMENSVSLQVNKDKKIKSNYKISIKEC